MPTGDPIAVTLLGKASYDNLSAGVSSGNCALSDGTQIDATEYFQTLGLARCWPPDGFLFINATPNAMVNAATWTNHCNQLGYPTESDLIGNVFAPPTLGEQRKDDQIPGTRPSPVTPGQMLYGAGAYSFQRSSAFFDNDGGVAFWCGANLLGIVWSFADSNALLGAEFSIAVTADLTQYASDVKTFYAHTVDSDNSILSDTSGGVTIQAGYRVKSMEPTSPCASYLVVLVRPK